MNTSHSTNYGFLAVLRARKHGGRNLWEEAGSRSALLLSISANGDKERSNALRDD
jgi:hypothetical protein